MARGPGEAMAVDDDAADVSARGATPMPRLKGTRPATWGGGSGGRVEVIAVEDEGAPGRYSPLPMAGLGNGKVPVKARIEEIPEKKTPSLDKGGKGAGAKKVDLMANPHLCLSASEQLDKARSEAATGLVEVLPWWDTTLGKPDPSPGDFKRTAEERFEALVRAVYAKGAARTKSAAGMLKKMAVFKSVRTGVPVLPVDLFPIEVGFMEAAKADFETAKGCKTQAAQMHEDIKLLRELGLEVPSQGDVESSLARPNVKRPAGSRAAAAPGGRQSLYPKHVCDIEFFSIHGRRRDDPAILEAVAASADCPAYPAYPAPPLTEDGDLMPVHVYAIAEWVMLAACDRGAGIWASTWGSPVDEKTAKYTACLDKDGRTDVERVVPNGGFECEAHPLVVKYSAKMEGRSLTPFFVYEKGESMRPEKSIRWVGPKEPQKQPRLPVVPVAAKSTAMGALKSARSYIIGVPEATLAALKISGTHTDRHVAPEIAELLAWPDPEQAVLGDWSDPDPESAGAAQRKKKAKVSFALVSNAATYHPKATEEHTMQSRKRLTDAARAFIARAGGYDALEPHTKWSDIIPRKSPGEEFDEFYGPSWSVSGADRVGEAVGEIDKFLKEARRGSRLRSPSGSKEA